MKNEMQHKIFSHKTGRDLLNLKSVSNDSSARFTLKEAQNELQKELIKIFKEILRVEEIGINSDFFKTGGNSLRAIQLISSIQKVLHICISLVDVFKNPTIEELAHLIDCKESPIKSEDIKPIQKAESYPASHSQKRMWIIDHFDNKHTAYNMADAFYLEGVVNREALERSFKKVIELHESLRTVFIVEAGELKQKVIDNELFKYNLNFLQLKQEENANELAKILADEEASNPFDLTKGPLLRTKLIQVEENRYVFLLTLHHIISDGISMNILVQELKKIYNNYCKGLDLKRNPLRVQYKDYVYWLNTLLTTEQSDLHKQYWMKKFSGGNTLLNLTDRPRNVAKSFLGKTIFFEINQDHTRQIKELSNSYGFTIFMVLQAFVNVLINKYSGEDDISIGTPVSGRIHKDLENQIGLYLNNIVLRNKIDESENLIDFLQQIKITTLDAFEHQHYPYDKLIEDLNIKPLDGRNPLYDVMIVMETNEEEEEKENFEGFTMKSLYRESLNSKLDLTFFFRVYDNIKISLEYNTDLFKMDQMQNMLIDLNKLITSYFEDQGLNIAGLREVLLDQSEQEKLKELNAKLIGSFNQDF